MTKGPLLWQVVVAPVGAPVAAQLVLVVPRVLVVAPAGQPVWRVSRKTATASTRTVTGSSMKAWVHEAVAHHAEWVMRSVKMVRGVDVTPRLPSMNSATEPIMIVTDKPTKT
jgi:hypothetical protein